MKFSQSIQDEKNLKNLVVKSIKYKDTIRNSINENLKFWNLILGNKGFLTVSFQGHPCKDLIYFFFHIRCLKLDKYYLYIQMTDTFCYHLPAKCL